MNDVTAFSHIFWACRLLRADLQQAFNGRTVGPAPHPQILACKADILGHAMAHKAKTDKADHGFDAHSSSPYKFVSGNPAHIIRWQIFRPKRFSPAKFCDMRQHIAIVQFAMIRRAAIRNRGNLNMPDRRQQRGKAGVVQIMARGGFGVRSGSL